MSVCLYAGSSGVHQTRIQRAENFPKRTDRGGHFRCGQSDVIGSGRQLPLTGESPWPANPTKPDGPLPKTPEKRLAPSAAETSSRTDGVCAAHIGLDDQATRRKETQASLRVSSTCAAVGSLSEPSNCVPPVPGTSADSLWSVQAASEEASAVQVK